MCILRAFLLREVAIAVVAVPRRGGGRGAGKGEEEAGRGTAAAGFTAKGIRSLLRLGRAGELGFPYTCDFNKFIFLN